MEQDKVIREIGSPAASPEVGEDVRAGSEGRREGAGEESTAQVGEGLGVAGDGTVGPGGEQRAVPRVVNMVYARDYKWNRTRIVGTIAPS